MTVYDRDTFGKDEFEGMFYVPLEPEEMINLRDQMKHDLWFELFNEQGEPHQGRIRLMV